MSFNSLFKEEADIAIIIDYLKDFPTYAPADNLDSLKSSVINFMWKKFLKVGVLRTFYEMIKENSYSLEEEENYILKFTLISDKINF